MKKVTATIFFILVLLISASPIMSLSALAASQFTGTITFINHNELTVNVPSNSTISSYIANGTYTSKHNSTLNYYSSNNSGSCYGQTHIAGQFSLNSWYIYYYEVGSTNTSSKNYGTSNCVQHKLSISNFQKSQNFNIFFKFVNGGQISATNNTHVFNITSNKNGQATFSYNDSGCTSTFTTNSYTNNSTSNQLLGGQAAPTNNPAANNIAITSGQLTVSTPTKTTTSTNTRGGASTGPLRQVYNQPFGSGWPSYITKAEIAKSSPCSVTKVSQTLQIQDPTINSKLATALNNPNASTSTSSSSSSSSQGLSCGLGFNPLNWAFCGLIKLGLSVVSAINNIIYSELNIGTCSSGGLASSAPNQIFGSCSINNKQNNTVSTDYHAAWNSFRDIALALLVIMTLVILIAQGIKG